MYIFPSTVILLPVGLVVIVIEEEADEKFAVTFMGAEIVSD